MSARGKGLRRKENNKIFYIFCNLMIYNLECGFMRIYVVFFSQYRKKTK